MKSEQLLNSADSSKILINIMLNEIVESVAGIWLKKWNKWFYHKTCFYYLLLTLIAKAQIFTCTFPESFRKHTYVGKQLWYYHEASAETAVLNFWWESFLIFFLFRAVCFLFCAHEVFCLHVTHVPGRRGVREGDISPETGVLCHPMCAEGCTPVLCKNSVYS